MNFKQLTYKLKLRYLYIGVFLFAVIVYKAAISTTINLYSDNSKLSAKIKKAENAPLSIAELRKSLEKLDDKLNHYLIDTTKEQEHTLEVVSEFCNKNRLELKELPKRKVTIEKDFTIITSVLKIEGNFSGSIKLLNELEYLQKLGRLSSVSWKSYIDSKTKKTILCMTIYLQNITVNTKLQDDEKLLKK